ncbi:DUF202 domain-containing protein [Streptomyces jeddahensis]|uniref:DUF202 domain-containing protein n=1 Tax=Streptomyces jeddahensis TaxID=1716141 RepID=A0A177HZW3_9ACTN|nr:DUF202 domain-containing protein [Streptomyces jeddahensis]OAH15708.1 hypothetical protein STSP_09300 [Streptomyces jeddahensis]
MTGPAGARDPGLQPERTRLAWRRTTLACTVAAVLAARTTLHGGPTALGVVACALCFLAWLGFLAVAHRRIRALAQVTPAPLTPRHAVAAAACALVLAAFAAAVIY